MRSEAGASAVLVESANLELAPLATVLTWHDGAGLRSPLKRRELQLALEAMCATVAAHGRPIIGIELCLLRDADMAVVNASRLGCNGSTNVLSFPGASGMAGTLLLSVDALERECLFYGQEPSEHLLRLLAHGVGHLAGLEHGLEMEALCAACLQAARSRLGL